MADRHVELAGLPLDGLLPGRGAEPVSDRRAGLDDPANRYVQRAELNGRPIERAWFRHSEIAKGGRLVLHMGPAPKAFGTRELPPSLSTDALLRCE